MVGLISSLERKFKLFFQESELANFHSFTCRFCKELTKIQKKKKKKDPDGRQKKSTSGIYWAYRIGRFFIRGFRFCNICWGHQFSGQAMHGKCFSFKVWKVFHLLGAGGNSPNPGLVPCAHSGQRGVIIPGSQWHTYPFSQKKIQEGSVSYGFFRQGHF